MKMQHITEEYGQETNLLVMNHDDYYILDKFLRGLGVRIRTTEWHGDTVTIQGDNPYKDWISREDRKLADRDMTDDAVDIYKR